jgi:hypothetical protein
MVASRRFLKHSAIAIERKSGLAGNMLEAGPKIAPQCGFSPSLYELGTM